MAYEDDVFKNVMENANRHVLFYFGTYKHLDQKDQAAWRNAAIEREQSWLYRDVHESGRLRMVEHLDSNPNLTGSLKKLVENVRWSLEGNASIGPANPNARNVDPAEILKAGLAILEGGFFGALAQGISNLIWSNDPQKALEKAAPFVTIGNMLDAYGSDFMAGRKSMESANDSRALVEKDKADVARAFVTPLNREADGNEKDRAAKVEAQSNALKAGSKSTKSAKDDNGALLVERAKADLAGAFGIPPNRESKENVKGSEVEKDLSKPANGL